MAKPKIRNRHVVAMMRLHGGAHQKTNKARRQQERQEFKRLFTYMPAQSED